MTVSAYERARLSRDARFDGRFFVAVSSTGIYCRPVCPALQPNSRNIRFYDTAAAAEEAGYRPCLRVPGCWDGFELALPGIGDWTAQYIALRALRDPDAFPAGDLGLQRALSNGRVPAAGEIQERTEGWRPWRAYAAMVLWKKYGQQTKKGDIQV